LNWLLLDLNWLRLDLNWLRLDLNWLRLDLNWLGSNLLVEDSERCHWPFNRSGCHWSRFEKYWLLNRPWIRLVDERLEVTKFSKIRNWSLHWSI